MLCIDSVSCLQNNTIKTNKYLAVYNNQTIKQTVMKQSDKKRSKDALTITKKDLCSMRTDNVTVTQSYALFAYCLCIVFPLLLYFYSTYSSSLAKTMSATFKALLVVDNPE